MARTNRRQFTAEQKEALLKRPLIDHVPVSALCEENGIQPSVFYHWKRQLFEQAVGVFGGGHATALLAGRFHTGVQRSPRRGVAPFGQRTALVAAESVQALSDLRVHQARSIRPADVSQATLRRRVRGETANRTW